MAIKLCHHIKEDGIWCKSAALHGRDYCYFHLTYRGRRMRIAQHRARQKTWRLELPPLEDQNAVQVAIMQVLDAITEGRISRHDAGHVLYGLQTAASNLRGKEGRVCFEVEPSAENRCVAYDSFEEDFGLTEDETTSELQQDASAAASVDPTLSPTAGDESGAQAAKKENAAEPAGEEAPSPIILDRLMAMAEDGPAETAANLISAATPAAPKKPPRALRPPDALRQSPEEAAVLAKQHQATAPECGRLDKDEITKCKTCEVLVFKRLAQYWEARNHPDDWLPSSGTIACLDCQLKHLTTLGKHLDEKLPLMFDLFMILDSDGGESPGDFDHYFYTVAESLAATGTIPDDWKQRLRRDAERYGAKIAAEIEDGESGEEGEASA